MIKQLLVKAHSLIKKVFAIVLLLIIVLVGISFVRSTSRVFSSQARLDQAKSKLEEVKREQEEIKRELSYIESDFYKDKQARDMLGLVKEGEIVVVMPEDEILRRLSPRRGNEEETSLPEPNWKKWFNLFFDR